MGSTISSCLPLRSIAPLEDAEPQISLLPGSMSVEMDLISPAVPNVHSSSILTAAGAQETVDAVLKSGDSVDVQSVLEIISSSLPSPVLSVHEASISMFISKVYQSLGPRLDFQLFFVRHYLIPSVDIRTDSSDIMVIYQRESSENKINSPLAQLRELLEDLPPAAVGDAVARNEMRILIVLAKDVQSARSARWSQFNIEATKISQAWFGLPHSTLGPLALALLNALPIAWRVRCILEQLILSQILPPDREERVRVLNSVWPEVKSS